MVLCYKSQNYTNSPFQSNIYAIHTSKNLLINLYMYRLLMRRANFRRFQCFLIYIYWYWYISIDFDSWNKLKRFQTIRRYATCNLNVFVFFFTSKIYREAKRCACDFMGKRIFGVFRLTMRKYASRNFFGHDA